MSSTETKNCLLCGRPMSVDGDAHIVVCSACFEAEIHRFETLELRLVKAIRTVECLKRAASIVRKGWCQEFYATDEAGEWCMFNAPQARRFCVTSAITVAAQSMHSDVVEWNRIASLAFKVLLREFPHGVVGWNDAPGQTAEAVAAKLEELARRESGAEDD